MRKGKNQGGDHPDENGRVKSVIVIDTDDGPKTIQQKQISKAIGEASII